MTHSNCAVATLPGICVGSASGLRRAVVEAGRRGVAARHEVARHLERPHHAPDIGRVRRRHLVGDGECRCVTLDDTVGEVVIAELRERVVADREHPPGEASLRGDREVPRLVQVRAVDLRALQRREDRRVARQLTALVLRQLPPVAQQREPPRRLDHVPAAVAQVAQRDDVGVTLEEVLAGVDQQVDVLRRPVRWRRARPRSAAARRSVSSITTIGALRANALLMSARPTAPVLARDRARRRGRSARCRG